MKKEKKMIVGPYIFQNFNCRPYNVKKSGCPVQVAIYCHFIYLIIEGWGRKALCLIIPFTCRYNYI